MQMETLIFDQGVAENVLKKIKFLARNLSQFKYQANAPRKIITATTVGEKERAQSSRFKKNHHFHADEMQPQMIDFEVTIAHIKSKSLFLEKSFNFKNFS